MTPRHLVLLTAIAISTASQASGEIPVRDGDIIFHTSRSAQSVAVQRATHSPYSHMGVVLFRAGKPWVLEAVATVRYTPLEEWIARGVGGHFVVKRLKTAQSVLSPDALATMRKMAVPMEGRPYDAAFEWSDERLYCSELVWKLYERALGIRVVALQRLKDFDLSSREVRAKVRERYGSHVPLDEPVIAPGAMFSSALLETVAQR